MPEKRKENIILIGAMGSGKSSVGQRLAQRMRLPFFDTDRIVEARARADIKDLIAQRGEAYFRSRETSVIESLKVRHDRYVLGTSGGVVTQQRNLAVLRSLGWVVLLHAETDELFRRVSQGEHRSIFKEADPRARFEELLAARQPLYAKVAHSKLDTTKLSVEEVVERIAVTAPKVFAYRPPAKPKPSVKEPEKEKGLPDVSDLLDLLDLF